VVPLFRRPAEIVVGRGAGCQWRFELASIAEAQLRLSWDGVRLWVEELDPGCATRLDGAPLHAGPHRVRPGQAIVAGELAIDFELQLFSGEVTQIRHVVVPVPVVAPPPPVPPVAAPAEDPRAPPRPWRCWVP